CRCVVSLSSILTTSSDPRDSYSFPTRRSSDLQVEPPLTDEEREAITAISEASVLSWLTFRGTLVGFDAAAVVLNARDCVETDERSEEHTSELQSHLNLVCRLLLEKNKPPTTPA